MVYSTKEIVDSLIRSISEIGEVQAIGISGGKTRLPEAGEGDIDIFIYCGTIPDQAKRQGIFDKLGDLLRDCKINVFEGGNWGTGDFVLVNGVETWLMYFTADETLSNVESILRGEYPDKSDGYYYPVGRCAMLKNINVLYDGNGFLNSLKKRLVDYPDKLAKILVQYHLNKLEDTEDLERAKSRGDVLFYHFAIDIAIDHFLQALFAMNRTYFPSRKRTLDFIESFKIKPYNCSEKLLEVVKLGSCADSIDKSYILWNDLVEKLKNIGTV